MPGRKGRSGGHNRKTARMHLVGGTFRPDRHGSRAAALGEIAESKRSPVLRPPAFLGKIGRAEFSRVARQLRARGDIHLLDRDALAAFAAAWEELVEATRGIQTDLAAARSLVDAGDPAKATPPSPRGMYLDAIRIVAHGARIMPTKDGLWAPSPAVRVAAAARRQVNDFARDFGMSPISLSRLRSAVGDGDVDRGSRGGGGHRGPDFPGELTGARAKGA